MAGTVNDLRAGEIASGIEYTNGARPRVAETHSSPVKTSETEPAWRAEFVLAAFLGSVLLLIYLIFGRQAARSRNRPCEVRPAARRPDVKMSRPRAYSWGYAGANCFTEALAVPFQRRIGKWTQQVY
jgi:hypothetical protein